MIRGSETCDDDGKMDNDGCDSSCQKEIGWSCSGEPSFCSGICGDGIIVSDETCEDDDILDGDGCSSLCKVESSYLCDS